MGTCKICGGQTTSELELGPDQGDPVTGNHDDPYACINVLLERIATLTKIEAVVLRYGIARVALWNEPDSDALAQKWVDEVGPLARMAEQLAREHAAATPASRDAAKGT